MTVKKNASIIMAGAVLCAFSGCTETKQIDSSQLMTLLDTNMAPQDVEFDWQSAYSSALTEFKSSEDYTDSSMFEILDITGDGSPELIISPSEEVGAQCIVYSFAASTLEKIATIGSYGKFTFIPEMSAIGYSYNGNGFEIGEYQTMQEGIFQTAVSFYTNSESASAGAVIRYEINNEEVTLAKYEEALLPYNEAVSFETGRKYTFGDDAIDYALHYSESWGAVLRDEQKAALNQSISAVFEVAELKDAAFELVDLDMNGVPEVVVSTGILSDSEVRIFYLDQYEVKELQTSCDTDGGIHFDISAKVFYATDHDGKTQCWSMSQSEINGFKPSDSTMKCGRKYLLTAENISKAFL